MTSTHQPLKKRRALVAALLGLGMGLTSPGAIAGENLVFVSGAFRRSIAVADLDHLAKTGQAKCPYCGTVYKLKAGEVVGHHH